MGVKVERYPFGMQDLGTVDDYPTATNFWYDGDEKIMYVEVSDVKSVGRRNEDFYDDKRIAAYPKGTYVRAYLDPVPEYVVRDGKQSNEENGQ